MTIEKAKKERKAVWELIRKTRITLRDPVVGAVSQSTIRILKKHLGELDNFILREERKLEVGEGKRIILP